VAQGTCARRPNYIASAAHARVEPPSVCEEARCRTSRVLGRRDPRLHDPGRRVHAPVRVLRDRARAGPHGGPEEPERIGRAVGELGLEYVVIPSVTARLANAERRTGDAPRGSRISASTRSARDADCHGGASGALRRRSVGRGRRDHHVLRGPSSPTARPMARAPRGPPMWAGRARLAQYRPGACTRRPGS